jgi:UDP-N-acetylmuramoyl-tripeptide--D-alanyl-D-alanine ligase
MKEAVEAFGSDARHFDSVESLEKAVAAEAMQGGSIMVKASNFMKLSGLVRKIVDANGVFRTV